MNWGQQERQQARQQIQANQTEANSLINPKNLQIDSVAGDGDCFFAAIAKNYPREHDFRSLRQLLCPNNNVVNAAVDWWILNMTTIIKFLHQNNINVPQGFNNDTNNQNYREFRTEIYCRIMGGGDLYNIIVKNGRDVFDSTNGMVEFLPLIYGTDLEATILSRVLNRPIIIYDINRTNLDNPSLRSREIGNSLENPIQIYFVGNNNHYDNLIPIRPIANGLGNRSSSNNNSNNRNNRNNSNSNSSSSSNNNNNNNNNSMSIDGSDGKSSISSSNYKIGDRVEFTNRDGSKITGQITQFHAEGSTGKYVYTVIDANKQNYTVHSDDITSDPTEDLLSVLEDDISNNRNNNSNNSNIVAGIEVGNNGIPDLKGSIRGEIPLMVRLPVSNTVNGDGFNDQSWVVEHVETKTPYEQFVDECRILVQSLSDTNYDDLIMELNFYRDLALPNKSEQHMEVADNAGHEQVYQASAGQEIQIIYDQTLTELTNHKFYNDCVIYCQDLLNSISTPGVTLRAVLDQANQYYEHTHQSEYLQGREHLQGREDLQRSINSYFASFNEIVKRHFVFEDYVKKCEDFLESVDNTSDKDDVERQLQSLYDGSIEQIRNDNPSEQEDIQKIVTLMEEHQSNFKFNLQRRLRKKYKPDYGSWEFIEGNPGSSNDSWRDNSSPNDYILYVEKKNDKSGNIVWSELRLVPNNTTGKREKKYTGTKHFEDNWTPKDLRLNTPPSESLSGAVSVYTSPNQTQEYVSINSNKVSMDDLSSRLAPHSVQEEQSTPLERSIGLKQARRRLFDEMSKVIRGRNYAENEKSSIFWHKDKPIGLSRPRGQALLAFNIEPDQRESCSELLLGMGLDSFLVDANCLGPDICRDLHFDTNTDPKRPKRIIIFPGVKVSLTANYMARAELVGRILVYLKEKYSKGKPNLWKTLTTRIKSKTTPPVNLTSLIDTYSKDPNALAEQMKAMIFKGLTGQNMTDEEDESSGGGGRKNLNSPAVSELDLLCACVQSAIYDLTIDTRTLPQDGSVDIISQLNTVSTHLNGCKSTMDEMCLKNHAPETFKKCLILAASKDKAAIQINSQNTNIISEGKIKGVRVGFSNTLMENLWSLIVPRSALIADATNYATHRSSSVVYSSHKFRDPFTCEDLSDSVIYPFCNWFNIQVQKLGISFDSLPLNYEEMWDQNTANFVKLLSAVYPTQDQYFNGMTVYECLQRFEKKGLNQDNVKEKPFRALCNLCEFYRMSTPTCVQYYRSPDRICHDYEQNPVRALHCQNLFREYIALSLYGCDRQISREEYIKMIGSVPLLCRQTTQIVTDIFAKNDTRLMQKIVSSIIGQFSYDTSDTQYFLNFINWFQQFRTKNITNMSYEDIFMEYDRTLRGAGKYNEIKSAINLIYGVNKVDIISGSQLPAPLEFILLYLQSKNVEKIEAELMKRCVKIFSLNDQAADTTYIMGKHVISSIDTSSDLDILSLKYDEKDTLTCWDLKFPERLNSTPEPLSAANFLDGNNFTETGTLVLEVDKVLVCPMYLMIPNGCFTIKDSSFISTLIVAIETMNTNDESLWSVDNYRGIMEDTISLDGTLERKGAISALKECINTMSENNVDQPIISQFQQFLDIVENYYNYYKSDQKKQKREMQLTNSILRKTYIDNSCKDLKDKMRHLVISVSTLVSESIQHNKHREGHALMLLTSVNNCLANCLIKTKFVKMGKASFSSCVVEVPGPVLAYQYEDSSSSSGSSNNNNNNNNSNNNSNNSNNNNSSSNSSSSRSNSSSNMDHGGSKIKMSGGNDTVDALEAINSKFGARIVVDGGEYSWVKINTQEEYDKYMEQYRYVIEYPNETNEIPITPNKSLTIPYQNPMINTFKNAVPNDRIAVAAAGGYRTRKNRNKNKNKSRKNKKTRRRNKKSNNKTTNNRSKKHKKIIKHNKTRSDN